VEDIVFAYFKKNEMSSLQWNGNVEEVCSWLDRAGYGQYKGNFKKADINGPVLSTLCEEDLTSKLSIPVKIARRMHIDLVHEFHQTEAEKKKDHISKARPKKEKHHEVNTSIRSAPRGPKPKPAFRPSNSPNYYALRPRGKSYAPEKKVLATKFEEISNEMTKSQPEEDVPSKSMEDKWKISFKDLKFDEIVGTGSAGEVYLGYYNNSPVAIKKLYTLGDDQKHLVSREYTMLRDLSHPNIVQFVGK